MKKSLIIIAVLILSSLVLSAKKTVLINEANGKPLVGVMVFSDKDTLISDRSGQITSSSLTSSPIVTYNNIYINSDNAKDTIYINLTNIYPLPKLSINLTFEDDDSINSVDYEVTNGKLSFVNKYYNGNKIVVNGLYDEKYKIIIKSYKYQTIMDSITINHKNSKSYELNYVLKSKYSKLKIKVTDKDLKPIEDVNVYIQGTYSSNSTNMDGFVEFNKINPDNCIITMTHSNFKFVIDSISLEPGQTLEKEYRLERKTDEDKTLNTDEILVIEDKLVEKNQVGSISTFYSTSTTKAINNTYSRSQSAGASFDDPLAPSSSSSSNIQAGSLTAGEVNDFRKWEMWADIASDELGKYIDVWGIEPTKRYTVQLTSLDNKPVSDAVVNLISQTGETIWSARSDNTGKAELWADAFKTINDDENGLSVEILYKGKRQIKNNISDFRSGINFVKVNEYCSHSQNVDIVFAMDATGSMGDEIEYLKTELLDIIERLQDAQEEKNLRIGSIFYRDFDYPFNELITTHDLTNDFASVNEFINSQKAISGNSTAEAVEVALSSAVNEFTWSEDAVARIMFLILDAPPHEDPQTMERFRELTARASAMGIRIIPLTASGIDKSSEYLMRSLALLTNGTYLFLTDDSGIGGSHIKPTTDSYDVEMMNEMIVRIINQFIDTPTCGESEDLYAKDINDNIYNDKEQKDEDISDYIRIFPNPTDGPVTLELDEQYDQMFVVDMNGKILFRLEPNGSRLQINLSEFPSGAYFLKYSYKGVWGGSQIRLMR
jgi:hypothetical protein